jgi:hypothetical protein
MKKQRQTELPRFVVGALATAGASMANAATVQITFANNFVANTGNGGSSSFMGDLTGDGVNDAGYLVRGRSAYVKNRSYRVVAGARFGAGSNRRLVEFGPVYSVGYGTDVQLSNVVAITFVDGRINGGATTHGWLDMTAQASNILQKVTLHRLIFDDASTAAPTGVTHASTGITEFSAVPEPSSLGLLALGAGGLLARRRRVKAAA